MTGSDLIKLCDACEITLKITPDTNRGFYYFLDGRHHITLSTKLSTTRRAFVGWHEFAHFLQNYYDPQTAAAFHGLAPDRPGERDADLFAMIALRPDEFRITGRLDFIHFLMTNEEDPDSYKE
jgi:Zn-dependent peptidase ImmA (M78 family)